MKLFGTDGIRGRAGEFPLNAAAVVAAGQALGERLGGRILVGQDTRISSPWIYDLLTQGVREAEGATIENAGVLPTPAVAMLTRKHDFSGGIMISASHNPFHDNGIKVFSPDGSKLRDSEEDEIELRVRELMPQDVESMVDAVPESGFSEQTTAWAEEYVELLRAHFRNEKWLSGLRIVLDCANGAMSVVAPRLMEQLGAEVRAIHASPTGLNINQDCGALHLESLVAAMKQETADFGVAFDGDGDRSLFVTSSGREVNGDVVLLLLARKLRPSRVVGTSMTNYALERKLNDERIELVRVDVGDRYVFEEMQRGPDSIGGEPSGHVIFPDFKLSGDGLLTALKLAEVIVGSAKSLDELTKDWVPAPHLLDKVEVARRIPLEQMPALQEQMKSAEEALKGCGRLVVRYSGTEPVLRLMIESDSDERNEEWMRRLKEGVRRDFSGI
jgi:phosphoglucosamine mutase